jgi:poly-gamma-glutamate capsule biosynthesis protein CapA/YwtB (metallophosphatase superfamily)
MSSEVLAAARRGNAEAIAYLINQAFEPKGVNVRAFRDANCLHILLESTQEPSLQLATLVKAGVIGLKANSIQMLRVYGRKAGQSFPAWTKAWALSSSASPLAPSPNTASSNTLSSIASTPSSSPPLLQPIQPPSLSCDTSPVQPLVPNISHPLNPAHTPIISQVPATPLPVRAASEKNASEKNASEKKSSQPPVFTAKPRVPKPRIRRRRTHYAVPIAFATGFIVGVNWNHFFANPFNRIFAALPSRPFSEPSTQRTIALTADTLESEAAVRSEAAEVVVSEEAKSEEVISEEAEVVEPANSVETVAAESPVPAPNENLPSASPDALNAPINPAINTASPIAETTITIKSVGDIIPGTNYPSNRLPDQDGNWLFDGVKDFFGETDILFGNFESTLTDYPYTPKDTGQGQTFAFRTPPHYANLLKDVGFDVLSVANNHSFDFDDQGFDDTIAHIEQAGMQAVGRRGQIVYRTVNGVTVAFIGFSYFADHNSIHELDLAKALVDEAKQQASIVVISVHAGAEGSDAVRTRNETEFFFGENRGNMVEFSRAMIDQGADLVLGHGPHVPRALELYNSRLIAYSLGNFMGYRTLSTDGVLGDSLILETQLAADGRFVSGKIIPVRLDDRGVPFVDDSFRSVSLIRNLIESDFPVTPLLIGNDGEIVINEAE